MSLNLKYRSNLAPAPKRMAGRFNRSDPPRAGAGHDRRHGQRQCAVMIPALVGLGTLAIDQGYYGYRNLLLKQTTQNAALAAAEKLHNAYSDRKRGIGSRTP